MRIDETAFDHTAKAVFIMNESAKERYDSWEDLRAFMMSMAYQYGYTSRHFSTGGFVLAFTPSLEDPDEIYVTASVMAYVAVKYAEKMALLEELVGA